MALAWWEHPQHQKHLHNEWQKWFARTQPEDLVAYDIWLRTNEPPLLPWGVSLTTPTVTYPDEWQSSRNPPGRLDWCSIGHWFGQVVTSAYDWARYERRFLFQLADYVLGEEINVVMIAGSGLTGPSIDRAMPWNNDYEVHKNIKKIEQAISLGRE